PTVRLARPAFRPPPARAPLLLAPLQSMRAATARVELRLLQYSFCAALTYRASIYACRACNTSGRLRAIAGMGLRVLMVRSSGPKKQSLLTAKVTKDSSSLCQFLSRSPARNISHSQPFVRMERELTPQSGSEMLV